MPTYRVRIEERYIETVEEIHHAYRDIYYESFYEVEADNAEEAQENYEHGERVSRTLVDTGDYYDSDYYESGEVLNEDFEEEVIIDCENTATGEIESPPSPRTSIGQSAFNTAWARMYTTAGSPSGFYYRRKEKSEFYSLI